MNMYPFYHLTKKEILVTDAMMTHLSRYIPALVVQYSPLLTQSNGHTAAMVPIRRLLLSRESIGLHHAVVSSLRGSSVWRTSRLLDASITYPFLLRIEPIETVRLSSSSTMFLRPSYVQQRGLDDTMFRLREEWLKIDRPALKQRSDNGTARIVLITYATEEKEEMKLLRETAFISGVTLKVCTLVR